MEVRITATRSIHIKKFPSAVKDMPKEVVFNAYTAGYPKCNTNKDRHITRQIITAKLFRVHEYKI